MKGERAEALMARNSAQVPFPEMGVDIVSPHALNSEGEEEEKEEDCPPGGVWTSAVVVWEDNWLFRQKKRSAALGAFRGGRYAAYYDPINMVIPNPASDYDRVRLGSRWVLSFLFSG